MGELNSGSVRCGSGPWPSGGHPQTPVPSASLRAGSGAVPLCTLLFHQPASGMSPKFAANVIARLDARRAVAIWLRGALPSRLLRRPDSSGLLAVTTHRCLMGIPHWIILPVELDINWSRDGSWVKTRSRPVLVWSAPKSVPIDLTNVQGYTPDSRFSGQGVSAVLGKSRQGSGPRIGHTA
ncbi:MAG: hypothetical protein HW388_468 [Dehalococcoidia bacterium]|nr:hypothetical protein [Dehalococcoidia bacterium]